MHTPFDPARPIQLALLGLVGALLAAFAIWSAVEPGISLWLAFDRADVAHGQWWRLLTGFLAHWTLLHATANASGIALLGWLIARRDGARIVGVLLLLSLSCQLPCLFALGMDAEYRGASGFVYTLAVFAWLRSMQTGRWRGLLLVLALGATIHLVLNAFALSGTSLLPTGIASTWQVHLAGLVAGIAGYRWRQSRATTII